MAKDKKSRLILNRLSKRYPNAASELNFKNSYQLVISAILSAQCTDKMVNRVTPQLFRKFPSFSALSKAPLKDIERIITPINYYRTKAKNIKRLSQIVTKELSGRLPKDFEGMVSLPGVGRKTANVVLGELGISKTLPVDTHVFRVARRLGLSSGKRPEDVEEDLKGIFPPSQWRKVHHSFILHGRYLCKAKNPKCGDCPLTDLCPNGTPKNGTPKN
ncbi:MAG: endonuclease III [Candidatus Dadabacteria bacterium]|nr:MAG: endonuclease III [Candidatus Dadabacteria bacterium]